MNKDKIDFLIWKIRKKLGLKNYIKYNGISEKRRMKKREKIFKKYNRKLPINLICPKCKTDYWDTKIVEKNSTHCSFCGYDNR